MHVQIHFIYSFLLYSTKKDFQKLLGDLQKSKNFQMCKTARFEEDPQKVEDPCRSILLDIPYYWIRKESPEDKTKLEGIPGELNLEKLKPEISNIVSIAKLFLSGFGTLRVTVDLECSDMSFTKSSPEVSGQTQDVIQLIKRLRKGHELLNIFENHVYNIKEALGEDYYWLERDKIPEGGSLERQMVKVGEIPWQIPYLLVCLKPKKFNYNVYTGRDFEAILLLSETPTGNTSFLLRREKGPKGKVLDMFPSESEFCYLGRDLTLLVGDPEKVERFDEEDVLYLLEILELLHLYCYTYIIANHVLDGEIANIAKALRKIRSTLRSREKGLKDVMEEAVNFTTNWFDEKVILTRFMEEPIIHRSVGKYARVYAQGVDIFKLREFKKALVDKVALLNRLYDDMMEEIRLRQYIKRLLEVE